MGTVTVRLGKARVGLWLTAALTILGIAAVISIVVGRQDASGDRPSGDTVRRLTAGDCDDSQHSTGRQY